MVQMGLITIVGYVGNEPAIFSKAKGTICSFRLGCTRGYYDASHVWHSFPTTWLTVKTFRRLAENVHRSVRKGDPVIVTGQLNTEVWTQDNAERSRLVVEASSVGHDLNGGAVIFQKSGRTASRPDDEDANPEERMDAQGARDDSFASAAPSFVEPVRIEPVAQTASRPTAANWGGEKTDREPMAADRWTESDTGKAGESVAESDREEFAGPEF